MNDFNKTREVTLDQFKKIWSKGGVISGGNQFSNMDSHDYLWTEDLNRKKIQDAEILQFEEWRKTCEMEVGSFGIGKNFKHMADWKKSFEWREKIESLSPRVTNITKEHSGGWVVGQYIGGNHYDNPVPPLPEDWDEVYMEHRAYGTKTQERLLVARNNKDGTVQLFKA